MMGNSCLHVLRQVKQKGKNTDWTDLRDLTDQPGKSRMCPSNPSNLFNACSCLYSAQRRKIKEPFVPPNPKEFDSAMFTLALRDLFGT